MSHEVSLAYGDMRRVSELEAQLASAHEALLLAQADAEVLRAAIMRGLCDPTPVQLASMHGHLIDAVRAEHPGQALHDEVAAARALRAVIQPLGSMAAITEACIAYDEAVKARGDL